MMKMIKEIELLYVSSRYNTNAFAVEEFNKQNTIVLHVKSIEEFFEYLEINNFKIVYYLYKYYDINEYLIPYNLYTEESLVFKKAVRKHNEKVKRCDFSKAYNLILGTVHEGILVYVEIEDDWMSSSLANAENAIEKINKEVYGKSKRIKEHVTEPDKEELMKIMFADPEFQDCHNQALRYWYLKELLETKEMRKYKRLFGPHFGTETKGKAKAFLDKAWMLYNDINNS